MRGFRSFFLSQNLFRSSFPLPPPSPSKLRSFLGAAGVKDTKHFIPSCRSLVSARPGRIGVPGILADLLPIPYLTFSRPDRCFCKAKCKNGTSLGAIPFYLRNLLQNGRRKILHIESPDTLNWAPKWKKKWIKYSTQTSSDIFFEGPARNWFFAFYWIWKYLCIWSERKNVWLTSVLPMVNPARKYNSSSGTIRPRADWVRAPHKRGKVLPRLARERTRCKFSS